MKTINLIFPNQLFENSELLNPEYDHYIIEEFLFLTTIISTNKKYTFIDVL